MDKPVIKDSIPQSTRKELVSFDDFTAQILYNRGIKKMNEAEKFLNPVYERDIYDPMLIKGMGRAVERILLAIDKEEKIIIYGDYDCDGIPASVILHDFFKKIEYKNFPIFSSFWK